MTEFPSEEYELIRRIRDILPPVDHKFPSPYEVAIGDDAAIRANRVVGEKLVVTADVSVENVHFSVDTMSFEEIGYKAMASNLSDCAAMGAIADGAVVQLVFPKGGIGSNNGISSINNINTNGNTGINGSIEQIYAGFSKACKRWNFPIIGGDLSGGAVWTIAITLIGSAPPGCRLLKRTGIVDGDALWVTGLPGGSAAGLAAIGRWGRAGVPIRYRRFVDAHVAPTPAIDEGGLLAANGSVHAMMDLSDGLSKDVATLCFDNRLGFIFDADVLKNVPRDMTDLAGDIDANYRDWFYHGGEEYELLFACEPSFDPFGSTDDGGIGTDFYTDIAADSIAKMRPDIMRLGCFTSKARGVFIRNDDGKTEELRMGSWDHIGR